MLKKLFLYALITVMNISTLWASAESQSAASTESSYTKPLTQNIQMLTESTALLRNLLGSRKQAAPSTDADIKVQIQKIETEIKEAESALQQEKAELSNLNTFLSSIGTIGSITANIKRYDTEVIPNRIRKLYGIKGFGLASEK